MSKLVEQIRQCKTRAELEALLHTDLRKTGEAKAVELKQLVDVLERFGKKPTPLINDPELPAELEELLHGKKE